METLRGSLEKTPGRTGTHGSDPLDPDPAAEDVTVRVLILAAGNRSDGSGAMGARGGGEARRSRAPEAALHRSWPKSAAPGLKSTIFWLWVIYAT